MPSSDMTITTGSAMIAKTDYACPVCASIVTDNETQHVCESCSTPHHRDCWEYAGGCAIFGCRKDLSRERASGDGLEETIAPVNLKVIKIWNWLFRMHWVAFLFVGLGFASTVMGMSLYMLVTVLAKMTSLPFFFLTLGLLRVFLWIPPVILIIGALSYILLLLPFAAMTLCFHTMSLSLPPVKSSLAKSIADKVDIPPVAMIGIKVSAILRKLAELLIVMTLIMAIAEIMDSGSSGIEITLSLVFLPLARVLIRPVLDGAVKSRITYITTFQNRLIASSKQSKE